MYDTRDGNSVIRINQFKKNIQELPIFPSNCNVEAIYLLIQIDEINRYMASTLHIVVLFQVT